MQALAFKAAFCRQPLCRLSIWAQQGSGNMGGTACADLRRQQDRRSKLAIGALDGQSFLTLLRHPFMHRSHTSFGHIADFGSMGLQELYNLRVAGGLNNINARVGDFDLGFDLFVDVKKRI